MYRTRYGPARTTRCNSIRRCRTFAPPVCARSPSTRKSGISRKTSARTPPCSTAAWASHVLPVLLALLGSLAYNLRDYTNRVRARTYHRSYLETARNIVAVIAGSIVGYFAGFAQGLSLLAAAFLVGYGVEIFFAFLELDAGHLRRQKNRRGTRRRRRPGATGIAAAINPVRCCRIELFRSRTVRWITLTPLPRSGN